MQFEGKVLFSFYLPGELIDITETELHERCWLCRSAKSVKIMQLFFKNYKDNDLRKLDKDVLLKLLQGIKGVGIYNANVIASSTL